MAQSGPTDYSQLVSTIGQLVTWALVICGWLVVNWQHNKREARKELRAQLDKLRTTLSELEGQAEQYHTAPEHSEAEARRVKVMLQRLVYSLDHLNLLNNLAREMKVIALRRAITYRNFDTPKHSAQAIGGELIAGINAAVDDLVNALEERFRSRFPVT